ncbi:endolytic peptidoglycan transglycosylase RlpA, partial [Salmonella enterica subsp. enterica serovar Typhimurium]|nr:endolytic peptidoglycan transglycosylase RlpA [Salmonella enterica subsp. enterica serovar Typhimurium]
SGGMGSASSAPAQPQGDVLPVSNSTLKSDDTTGAPVSSSGFLGAPTTLAPGVLESNEPTPAPQPAPVSAPVAAPATAPATATPVSAPAAAAPVSAPVSAPAAAASGRFVVQVGAVSDQTRAQQYQQRLSQQFSVPGRVIQNGAVWRIQLGPFASKAEASALQQRLQTEAQLQSFIASAQ